MTSQPTSVRIALLGVLALVLAVEAKADTADAGGGWANALKPAGATAPPLTVVADGTPRYAILVPAEPTGPERKAAADLQEWAKQITGAAVLVVTENQKPAGVSRFISVV